MAAARAAPCAPPPDYAAEVRFGVVLYGGLSLAIYIHGVAEELYEMACATPKDGLGRAGAGGTREVYRRLAWLAGNPALRQRYAAQLAARAAPPGGAAPADVWDAVLADPDPAWQPTRLVVDVIAGASAGGINGVFLAKALASGAPLAPLRRLWVQEADIARLLNDRRSYADLGARVSDRSAHPASLLNGDRVYLKLHAAMRAMSQASAGAAAPPVDRLDLFVTTTDISGSAVALRLADRVVHERRFRQNLHFRCPDGAAPDGNDFVAANDAMLAFAARCTSSFPFAFEPMTLDAVTRLHAHGAPPGVRRWDAFFAGLPAREVAQGRHVRRAFGDGGVLDNKPFSYVVDTLSDREGALPIERKLVYVEPSPQEPDPDEITAADARPPDALSDALSALLRIPRVETIREDLQAVLRRNRRIERVERMVRLGEADIEAQPDPFARVLRDHGEIPPWATVGLSQMVRFYGVAFLPYHRLRVYSVTDRLAARLAVQWGLDPASDHLYALRALVRAWRERHFTEEPAGDDARGTLNAFLDQFDLDYRVRRLGFLLRKADQIMRLLQAWRAAPPVAGGGDGADTWLRGRSDSDRQIVRRLRDEGWLLPQRPAHDPGVERALAALRALKHALHRALDETRRVERRVREAAPPLDETLRQRLEPLLSRLLDGAGDGPAAPPAQAEAAAAVSRTLQERVFVRAQALLAGVDAADAPPLAAALAAGLAAMRLKRPLRPPGPSAPAAESPAADAIGYGVWALLGQPRLAIAGDDAAQPVRVDVDDTGVPALDGAEGRRLRRFLGEYYLRFDAFDQMSFPLYYDTGTGEPATVDVLRISPQDARNLVDETLPSPGPRKLAGTALFSFGAFLEERWRRNDLLWGRLDGAERLVQALLPMTDAATVAVRRELVDLAQRRILREMLVPEGQAELTGLLCRALEELPGGDPGGRLRDLLARLNLGDGAQRERLAGVLASLLDEQGLLDHMRARPDVDRTPDPKASLDSAARAVTITGRLLHDIARRQGRDSVALRWLARAGLAMQAMLAVSLPGGLRARWWSHGLKLLYAFELVGLALAMLLGTPTLRSLALTALGVTLAAHLASLLAGDLLRSRTGWLRLLMAVLAAAVLALAAAGGLALWRLPWAWVLCGPAGATPAATPAVNGLFDRVCAASRVPRQR